MLTSLPLEILYYFGGWYDVVFWVILFLVFIYKGFELPYTTSTFGMEFSFVFLYLLIEPARLFLGTSVSPSQIWTTSTRTARFARGSRCSGRLGIVGCAPLGEQKGGEQGITQLELMMRTCIVVGPCRLESLSSCRALCFVLAFMYFRF